MGRIVKPTRTGEGRISILLTGKACLGIPKRRLVLLDRFG